MQTQCPGCRGAGYTSEVYDRRDGVEEKVFQMTCRQCKGKGHIPFPGAKKK